MAKHTHLTFLAPSLLGSAAIDALKKLHPRAQWRNPVMLAVGLIIGQLTAGLRYQSRISRQRESRARGLGTFAQRG